MAIAAPASVVVDTSRSPFARLRPVPLGAVQLHDAFWEPRRRVNREVTLPEQYRQCKETGRIDNFRRAAGRPDIAFQGAYFNDSDVYKWVEAVAWSLCHNADPRLQAMLDSVVSDIVTAQQHDGYLNTYFMYEKQAERWSNLRDKHELYCAGHLLQAAIACARAGVNSDLLPTARRLADHICDVFGPESEGKRPGVCGHPEIEMALVEMARLTGESAYLEQARYFVEARGQGLIGGSPYHQDHAPLRSRSDMVGHAVRALYLNAGAADLCAELNNAPLLAALCGMWRNMTERRMYVTGGIGARYEGEAFGGDYELPNERAYAETCAAIASAMWSWRMLLLTGQASYADALELALYNGVLAGIGLDGETYFYENPLANDGTHRRQPWFGCACCPPNIARLLASLPGYFYSVGSQEVWVHLYAAGVAHLTLPGGETVELHQRTGYPWDGEIEIEVHGAGDFGLFLRVPGWCEAASAGVAVNGRGLPGTFRAGEYFSLRRTWREGDIVRLSLPMPARRLECHPYVAGNRGRVALMRGPLVYCCEGVDHPDIDLFSLRLDAAAAIEVEFHPRLLDGVTILKTRGVVAKPPGDAWLYRPLDASPAAARREVEVVAVPYYAWANRAAGPMQVWLETAPHLR